MVAREIALYLAGAGLGLTAGENLYWRPLAPSDPDVAVAVLDAQGEADERVGSAEGAAVLERPHCLVVVRGARDGGVEAVAALAAQIRRALRRIGDAGHDVLGGTDYLDGQTETPPYPAPDDENGRPRYLVEFALTRMTEAA